MDTNVLYYGDNLNILRDHIPDESVDLVYLDPPFNSSRAYNVIFKDESKRKENAQIEAFDDTWHWGPHAEETFLYLTNTGHHQGRIPESVSALVGALRKGIRPSPMLAYLVEMAVRLVELHRVLKSTGSLYLHCDPTASHYLKLVLDAIFGPERFLSEVIWKRSSAHSSSHKWSPVHDSLLCYAKGPSHTWNPVYGPLPKQTADAWYNNIEAETGRRFNRADLTAAGTRTGSSGQPWRGIDPTSKGRHWAIPGFIGDIVKGLDTQDALDALNTAGRIFWPKRKGGIPMLKRYLDEARGVPPLDVLTDISPLNNVAAERLGYPTQKPLALLERIIAASSNEGDIVLDPFCGCGTALIAAQTLGRKWIGIDITYLSIAVMRARLHDSFPEAFPELTPVRVIGQPTEVEGARMLAQQSGGRKEFELWAVSLVGAQPSGSNSADHGIDGRLTFTDNNNSVRTVLVSVKSGHTNVAHVRDLIGTMQREDAPLGLFITLEEPSKPMLQEAAEAGRFHSELANRDYQRVQVVTVGDLLQGRKPELPLLLLPTYQQAEKVQQSAGQMEAFG